TETVCALGACERLVGVDRYSNFPASVDKLPKLGGLDDTQVETIVALRPDVVILAPSSRAQDRLASLGLRVVVL
ncbi:ABC transporter substrate-binding protein, partial [Roseateles sp. GG27B]